MWPRGWAVKEEQAPIFLLLLASTPVLCGFYHGWGYVFPPHFFEFDHMTSFGQWYEARVPVLSLVHFCLLSCISTMPWKHALVAPLSNEKENGWIWVSQYPGTCSLKQHYSAKHSLDQLIPSHAAWSREVLSNSQIYENKCLLF